MGKTSSCTRCRKAKRRCDIDGEKPCSRCVSFVTAKNFDAAEAQHVCQLYSNNTDQKKDDRLSLLSSAILSTTHQLGVLRAAEFKRKKELQDAEEKIKMLQTTVARYAPAPPTPARPAPLLRSSVPHSGDRFICVNSHTGAVSTLNDHLRDTSVQVMEQMMLRYIADLKQRGFILDDTPWTKWPKGGLGRICKCTHNQTGTRLFAVKIAISSMSDFDKE
eukprot:3937895-Rhodomonas_salina.1